MRVRKPERSSDEGRIALQAAAPSAAAALTRLPPFAAYVHGAYLILLDGLSLGLGLNEATAAEARGACQRFLTVQLTPLLGDAAAAAALVASAALQDTNEAVVAEAETELAASAAPRSTPQHAAHGGAAAGEGDVFGMAPFFVRRGDAPPPRGVGFELQAPSTARNCTRVLRALQVLETFLTPPPGLPTEFSP